MEQKHNSRHEAEIVAPLDNRYKNEVLEKQIKALLFHALVFLYWFLASQFLTDMFIVFGAIMWAIGAVAAQVMPNERESIIRNTHRFIVGFSSLIGYRLILGLLTSIPESEWSRALGVQVGGAFTLTAINYLTNLFTILVVMIPVGYVIAIGSTFFTFRSSVDVRERTEQIVRTGEQRMLRDRRTARRR